VSSKAIIYEANTIIREYQSQGFDLTLRQLYYQFVSRDLLKNTLKEYKRLGSVINDARLAGLIDWNCIVDRTRGIASVSTWEDPSSIIDACAYSFKINMWKNQRYRPEVWIEKEALAGVFERVCTELRVPYLSCRGYTSQSEMWRAGRRLKNYVEDGKTPYILHFGDHDPSGCDMSRDIIDRLKLFTGGGVEFNRLALNKDQVETYGPPPNPAKITDSRATDYIEKYGDESWELDALNPTILADLVRVRIEKLIDRTIWKEDKREEDEHIRLIGVVAEQWNTITEDM
jgi:hypothetical protein